MGISNTIPPSRLIQPGVVANTAARPSSPFEGQAIYQTDTDEVLYYNGTSWSRPANMPWGVAGKAQKTSATTVTTTETDISGMSVTWTADSTRLYKISVSCIARTTAAGNLYITINITDSANAGKQLIRNGATTQDLRFGLTGFVYESGLSGSVTRKLRVAILSGTGEIEASGGFPLQMIVEDIGPA